MPYLKRRRRRLRFRSYCRNRRGEVKCTSPFLSFSLSLSLSYPDLLLPLPLSFCQSHNESAEVLGTPVLFYAPICPQCVGDQNAPLWIPSPLLGSNCGDATWRFAQKIFAKRVNRRVGRKRESERPSSVLALNIAEIPRL